MTKPIDIPSGRIDLHSHLLPGIDDGCRDYDESLACVEQLMERGFVGSVCTPHIWPMQFPSNTPKRVVEMVAELREVLAREGLEYAIWPGGEVRIEPFIVEWLQEHGVPSLGPGPYVLVDYWGPLWPTQAEDLFAFLVKGGYRPILAHPERMGYDEEGMAEVMASVKRHGVLLQGNFASLSGCEGPDAAVWGRRLLREGRYDMLAMDMHRFEALAGRFEGIAVAEMDIGPEGLAKLLEEAPAKVLRGEKVR